MQLNPFGSNSTLADVLRERANDVATVAALDQGKLPGRIRTGLRAVPSSNSDVIAGDALGDVITDATYIYTLIRVSGSLKWDRRAHNVSW